MLKKSAYSYSEIANIVGCHKSTISREIKRNRGCSNYKNACKFMVFDDNGKLEIVSND
uniref:helix-turn-helix domain-containing protein n=1 Tax=Rappaport israeli TaxID=1839807 RepID=UPI001300E9D9